MTYAARMQTIGATQARNNLFQLLRESLKKNKQFRIPYQDGSAILMSEEEYESMLETLYLLSSPGFKKNYNKAKKEIKEGKLTDMSKVFGK